MQPLSLSLSVPGPLRAPAQKQVLILGAGVYQLPLIKACKRRGLRTVVASIPGPYPGFVLADKARYVNTLDKEGIRRLAEAERVDAILTTGTDTAVATIGYVCDRLGLRGISQEKARLVTDKGRQKSCLQDAGVRTAEGRIVRSPAEARAAVREMGLPLIFKSVDLSGSRGIARVREPGQAEAAYVCAASATRCDHILVERFLEGCEIGVDGYIGDGDPFIVPHGKLVYDNGAANVPIGHRFPFSGSDALLRDIREQITRALRGLGLRRVFFNADAMICGGKCYLLELGARCGATCIPELISAHYGMDYYEKMIDNALGLPVTFPHRPVSVSMGRLLLSDKTGRITRLCISHPLPEIDALVLDHGVGDAVKRFAVGSDRIGHVIAHGRDQALVEAALRAAMEAVHITVE